MKMVEEIKIDFFNFYFLDMDFSLKKKLKAVLNNILLRVIMSQNFDLAPSYVFMIQNINNEIFYIT